MSEGSSNVEQGFPELRQEDLHEIVPSLLRRAKKASNSEVLDLVFDSTLPVKQKTTLRSATGYDFTNSPSINENEITITKFLEPGRPNVISESLRFKFGNPALRDTILIEYSRSLRNGETRTFQNNLPAISLSEKFISQMEKDLQTKPAK